MAHLTTKPHPTPGVYRTRVWYQPRAGAWAYRLYLSTGGILAADCWDTEAEARREMALHYRRHFGTDCPTLLARADRDWPATGRHHRPKEQQA